MGCLLVTLAGLIAVPLAGAEDGWPAGGPLRFPNSHPLRAIFLETLPFDGQLPAKPTFELETYHFNTWTFADALTAYPEGARYLAALGPGEPRHQLNPAALAAQVAAGGARDGVFVVDTESTRLDFVYTQPFGRRWGLQLDVPLWGHHGGFFDPVIETFHSWFGYPADNRPQVGRNRTQVFYARGAESRSYDGPFEPALGDIVLRGFHVPLEETAEHPAVALSAALKAPVGPASRFLGSGRWDVNAAVHARRTIGDFRLYGTVGHTWHGGWSGLPRTPTDNTWDLHLGVSWQFADGWAFDVGAARQEFALATALPAELGKAAWIIGGGVRRRLDARWTLEGAFFENITEHKNTYDSGISLKLRWTP